MEKVGNLKRLSCFLLIFGFLYSCGPVICNEDYCADKYDDVYYNNNLKQKALQFLYDYNSYYGMAVRWLSLPIIIQLHPNMGSNYDGAFSMVTEAANYWTSYTGIRFAVLNGNDYFYDPVEELNEAYYGRVYIKYGNPFEYGGNYNDRAYAKWLFSDEGEMLVALIVVDRNYISSLLLAHELGHIMPINGHTYNQTIMDYNPCWAMDPIVAEAMRILYFELRPGSQIILY